MNIHSDLKKAIHTDNLIIFVGAGTSIPLGLPDWNTLVCEIINELKTDHSELAPFEQLIITGVMSPLSVLDHIQNHKHKILEVLTQKLKLDKGLDYKIQRTLLTLSKKIITTNYDKAFEFSTDKQLNIITDQSKFKLSEIDKKDEYIFKIHGD